MEEKFEHIESGIKVIKAISIAIKKPADKNSIKEIKESIKVLEKKLKMLYKDESLQAQYLDRTCYDTVQGVFQILHLYIISTTGEDDHVVVGEALDWLRTHENAYQIAARMQAAAEKRAEFGGK